MVTSKAAVHAAAKGKPQPADAGVTPAASKSGAAAAAKSAQAASHTAANGIAKEAKVKPAKQKAAPKPAVEDKPVDISRSVPDWQAQWHASKGTLFKRTLASAAAIHGPVPFWLTNRR